MGFLFTETKTGGPDGVPNLSTDRSRSDYLHLVYHLPEVHPRLKGKRGVGTVRPDRRGRTNEEKDLVVSYTDGRSQ